VADLASQLNKYRGSVHVRQVKAVVVSLASSEGLFFTLQMLEENYLYIKAIVDQQQLNRLEEMQT
jgi:hypothetical protein